MWGCSVLHSCLCVFDVSLSDLSRLCAAVAVDTLKCNGTELALRLGSRVLTSPSLPVSSGLVASDTTVTATCPSNLYDPAVAVRASTYTCYTGVWRPMPALGATPACLGACCARQDSFVTMTFSGTVVVVQTFCPWPTRRMEEDTAHACCQNTFREFIRCRINHLVVFS